MRNLGLSKMMIFTVLMSAGMKFETEGFIMVCQGGEFNTLVYQNRVIGIEVPVEPVAGSRKR